MFNWGIHFLMTGGGTFNGGTSRFNEPVGVGATSGFLTQT